MATSSGTATWPASYPIYTGTFRAGSCQLANADGTTAKDFSNFTPHANGTVIKEIRCYSGPTTAPGGTHTVQLFVHDGTNARILDSFTLSDAVNTLQAIFQYGELKLPTGYKIQAKVLTTLASGATLDFLAFGADNQTL